MRQIKVKNFLIGKKQPLACIFGPCVIESEEQALQTAEILTRTLSHLPISLIYKSSYDKANRSSIESFRGPGIQEGLKILENVRKTFSLPVLTDVHSPEEIPSAAQCCDILQIPAFLCRQTDLLIAAAKSGAVINVKKGQFIAPWDMANVVEKLLSAGCSDILLTERGATFGYNRLVVDMCSIPMMQKLGYPVCFDASHSVQTPGGLGSSSGGEREFIPHLARAAIAAGANALFIETHPNPDQAKSDRHSVFPLDALPALIESIIPIYEHVQKCTHE
jgi:2-dehydro-3-deoxyphosphooctonate aldolase (KDO 8-P synthase)